MKFVQALKDNIIIITVLLGFVTYALVRRCRQITNAVYTTGVVTDQHSGTKGEIRIGYNFLAGDKTYHNTMPILFFSYCQFHCCHPGDSVIVRYENGNPGNSSVVKTKR